MDTKGYLEELISLLHALHLPTVHFFAKELNCISPDIESYKYTCICILSSTYFLSVCPRCHLVVEHWKLPLSPWPLRSTHCMLYLNGILWWKFRLLPVFYRHEKPQGPFSYLSRSPKCQDTSRIHFQEPITEWKGVFTAVLMDLVLPGGCTTFHCHQRCFPTSSSIEWDMELSSLQKARDCG